MQKKPRQSHSNGKMVRDAGKISNAIVSQSDSLPRCCTAFWDGTETTYETDGYVTDKVTGVRLLEGSDWPWVASPAPGNAVNIARFSDAAFLSGGYDRQRIGTKDFLVVQVAQAKPNVYTTLTAEQQALSAGAFAFYITELTKWSFRMHPHYAVYQDDSTGERIATGYHYPLQYRNEDQIYVTAAGRRGGEIVHFAETSNTDETVIETLSTDIYSILSVAAQANWDNAVFNTPRYGHSIFGSDDGQLAGNTQGPSPIYGILVFIFADGMPSDVPTMMNWQKSELINNPTGEKRVYAPWITLI